MRIIITALLSAVLLFSAAAASDQAAYISEQSSYSKELLSQINHYRMSHGLKTLSFDKKLAELAQGHCASMQRSGVLCHDNFDQRFKKSGHTSCVENVGWNYSSPKELFVAWKNSSGHDNNMLAGDIQKAGISIVGTYVTFFACK